MAKVDPWADVDFDEVQELTDLEVRKRDLWSCDYIVSVLGRDEGYTVKYNPLPEGVPEDKARWNS